MNTPATVLEVIDDLHRAKDRAMRLVAQRLIQAYSHNIEDFVTILGEELSKVSTDHAIRTGDYPRVATLNIVANHLMALDGAIENYDGGQP